MQVLVVDDDPLAAEMIAAVLEDENYQPVIADNALAAMEQLNAQEDSFGLIVSDMNMPLMSGLELFRELRNQGNHLPFILLTGDNPDQLRQEEAGLDACIMKDFSLDASLPDAVARALGKQL